MVYNVIVNAVEQALQLTPLEQMSNQDFGELLNILTFLQNARLSPRDREKVSRHLSETEIEIESNRRNSFDVLMMILAVDDSLSSMISALSDEERGEFLDFLLKNEDVDQSLLEQKKAELKNFLLLK